MNAAETLEMIKVLHAVGATHFKSHDFEIQMKPGHDTKTSHVTQHTPQAVMSPDVPENTEATEKLKDLIKTMSLSPEGLVDVIFPAGAGL